jgi:hypothetical protein
MAGILLEGKPLMLAKKCCVLAGAVVLLSVAWAWGQQEKRGGNPTQPGKAGRGALPTVSELIERFDRNGDGSLTKEEVTDATFRQNFERWDADGDGYATAAEITQFRRGAGIPVAEKSNDQNVTPLTIPKVNQLLRVDQATRPDPEARRNSAFILKTSRHEVEGDRYIVLTDHTEREFLYPLERLAKHHNGLIARVDDLAALHRNEPTFTKVRQQLRDAKVRYLAIAPRMESYRENMLLGIWELISSLDDDPQLDAYPGILVATSAEKFAALIDRSIQYVPLTPQEFRPFSISQVPSTSELRSLQKAGILREVFASYGYQTPTVAVYSPAAQGAPRLEGKLFWAYEAKGPKDFLTRFPEAAAGEFNSASLLVMHGHGIPGMSCGVDIGAIPPDLSAQIVLVGSCFSAAPQKSDLPAMREAPGGYRVETRDAFALRAVDSGAKVVFGHMRLNQGFPHLFPVLESWLEGLTVGQAYQELMNAIIDLQSVKPGQFAIGEGTSKDDEQSKDNLLYVIIGDPAVHPLERIMSK